MPIKPENKSRYPKNWKEIRQRILQRANNRCEFCGVENHTYRYNPKTGKDAYIVLTIAHLDHTPENCSDDNLKALCQRCHNQYDAEHRKQTRKGNSAANNKIKSKMKKAMLSQPMAGKSEEEIISTREKAIKALKEKGFEIVNTLFTDEWYSKEKMAERGVVQIPLCFLAKSLENMSLCHAAYFCKGWENARGCKIEHEAAKAYGLEIIYEE